MDTYRNESITVGTDPVVISVERDNNNGKRVELLLQNVSTGGQVITVAVDATAAVGKGIVMSPGGNKDWTVSGDEYPPQKVVTAIASAAGGTLALYEEVTR